LPDGGVPRQEKVKRNFPVRRPHAESRYSRERFVEKKNYSGAAGLTSCKGVYSSKGHFEKKPQERGVGVRGEV